MFVNGVKVLVTRNCWEALWQARLHQTALHTDLRSAADSGLMPVFIDAVCINQEDPREKGEQVQLMGSIFDQAHQTLICPGWDGGDSKLFTDGINNMAAVIKWAITYEDWDDWRDEIDPNLTLGGHTSLKRAKVFERILNGHDLDSARSWLPEFRRFANQSYWTRAWIIPEILPAKDRQIMYDSKVLDLEVVRLVINRFSFANYDWILRPSHSEPSRYLGPDPSLGVFHICLLQSGMSSSLLRARSKERAGNTAKHLSESLSLCSEDHGEWQMELLGCKEQRDRVYCLLGVLTWRTCTGPPSCSYEVSPIQVVLDTFRNLHSSENSVPFKVMLKLLRWLELDAVSHYDQPSPRLASWVTSLDASRSLTSETSDAMCCQRHTASQNAAPISLVYSLVFRDPSGRLAIFARGSSWAGLRSYST